MPHISKQTDISGEQIRGKAQTIPALIEAAIELTSTKGPDGFSVREVASLAGVNHGLVHRHFGGKNELIRAALNQVAQQMATPIQDNFGQNVKAAELFNAVGDEPRYLQCLAWAMLSENRSELVQDVFPTIEATMKNLDESEAKKKFMLAFLTATTVGWHLFKPLILQAVQVEDEESTEIEGQLAELLTLLATNTGIFDEVLGGKASRGAKQSGKGTL